MAKNIIFLDIDGVLNNEACFAVTSNVHMEKSCVVFLYGALHLLEDCRLVVSSTWRINKDLEKFFEFVRSAGCEEIFEFLKSFLHEDWATKWLCKGKRGYEIQEWLSRHPEVVKYICLDDDSDYLRDQPLLLVNREYGFGLTEQLILLQYFGCPFGARNPQDSIRYAGRVLKHQKNFIKKYILG